MNPVNALGETTTDILLCSVSPHMHQPRRAVRTAGRPPVTIVLDRDDDVRFTRTALLSHDPAAGRLVIHPTLPYGHRQLWQDLIEALGAGRPSGGTSSLVYGSAEHRAAYAAAKAAPACQVTVLRTHLMDWAVCTDLIHLHRTTALQLVLVHHAELPDDFEHLLRHCDHRVIDTFAGMDTLHPPAASGHS